MGYQVGNIDLTIIAEKPKLAKYLDTIKNSLSDTMNIPQEHIGIKVTTNEGIGAIGRMEGIAAFAVCTLLFENLN